MRESNFCSPSQNKASIGITSALYDRRALDCTAVLPLVNSLSHLSFLTSTSSRIREILTEDEGLERLVRILKEGCRKNRLDMWKWQLAFQCVVNVGIRGSERVRTRVVEAEMVPVIVTILEGFLERLERDQEIQSGGEIRRMRYPFLTQMIGYSITEPMTEQIGRIGWRRWEMTEDNRGVERDNRRFERGTIESSRNLSTEETLSVLQLEESVRDTISSFSSMNEFVRGPFLSQTYQIGNSIESDDGNSDDVSSRERIRLNEGIQRDVFETAIEHIEESEQTGDAMEEDNALISDVYPIHLTEQMPENGMQLSNERSSELTMQESVQQPLFFDSRHFFFRNEDNVVFCLQLLAYISKYPQLRSYFQNSHDIPRLRYGNTGEIDEEKVTPINVFALVERFTLRIHPIEVQYWAGVIMRNACRKDESRGGIRQCAYIDCGRWETFNRQFAKCRRCRRTKYCSKQCQSRAWPGHRWWCRERASN
ncbi:hypothetical protein PNEG_01598 [Pneumocystis murina B123]|uniref:MYND-type domain-containing protein n=1 Tax=Pneumocystis murina (strain B123) TaxID=1069680 RepID=M7P933_PNEMU|nr:hypothetical protein PNEG_01598 [Pneumocystis murina B123]EMR10345.1 hypothetical protein PNEG_01598 [Pneumocystis murina B123]